MTTTITAAAPDIESLIRDYYIDSSRFIYDDDDDYDNTKKHQQEWSNEYDNSTSFSYRYCDVSRLDRADWLKYYWYSNKGTNRQLITICTKCLDTYNHKEYERKLRRLERLVADNNACLNNGNGKYAVIIGGVIDIKTAYKAKDRIMLAFKLAINSNNDNERKNTIDADSTTNIASNFDYDYDDDVVSNNNNNNNDELFYNAVRMAYDQSEDVRRYFRNNASRINPNNKRLWPLRYQAYKQFGI
jgi:hypothetical protein